MNDGIIDNSGFSWIPATNATNEYVGVNFLFPITLAAVVWQGQTGYNGRSGGNYTLEYTSDTDHSCHEILLLRTAHSIRARNPARQTMVARNDRIGSVGTARYKMTRCGMIGSVESGRGSSACGCGWTTSGTEWIGFG